MKQTLLLRIGFLIGIIPAALAQSPTNSPQRVWKWPTRFAGPCEYHPIPAESRAMVATVPEESQNLKSDGMGRYWSGNDTVRSYFGFEGRGYNFYTYWPETCEEPLPRKWRFLDFHLDSPEADAKPMGVIRDHMAMLHVFPGPKSAPIKDIGIGQTVSAQRVLLRFHRDGKIYFLRMGSEPFDRPLPGQVELLPGHGTTMARIVRETETKWTISSPPGSLARLSIWGAEPVDLGLYRFSFEILIETQRKTLR
jgi:hypothetical protein